MTTKKWIQKVKFKHGALHKQLKIDEEEKISVHLLSEIKNKPLGDYVIPADYSTSTKHYVKITPLLKKRANLALNLRKH
jgi:hypothetical protein